MFIDTISPSITPIVVVIPATDASRAATSVVRPATVVSRAPTSVCRVPTSVASVAYGGVRFAPIVAAPAVPMAIAICSAPIVLMLLPIISAPG